MPTFDTDGAVIYFETAGAGEPLVLIPGFASGIWSWFCQSELARDLRIITFDPRGIGKSRFAVKSVPSDITIKTFVEDVAGLLDAVGVPKAHILGASFGGFVAQEFVLRFPERVAKLILACTTAGGENHVSPDIEILRSFARDPARPLGEQIRKFFRPAFTEQFNDEHADTVEKVCQLREENEVAEAAYLAQLQAAFSFDADDRIGDITHETLVITGDQDNLVPMQNSMNLAEKIPNAVLKVLPIGSHMVFVEQAAEFNKIVTEFIRG